jgi:hypothetical protein
MHPFPADIERLVRELASLAPTALGELSMEAFDWEAGKNLDEARTKLQAAIAKRRGK